VNYLACDGIFQPAVFNGKVIAGVFTCSTGWKSQPSMDFQDLITLLSFSPEICAKLVGGCAVLFVLGYSSGFVARMLTRR
jgi:hypothetical protein